MKTMKLIKIIPVVLMGLFLSAAAGTANVHDAYSMNPEMVVTVESWMFDTDYLSGDAQPVECWMLDESWLDQVAEAAPVESWMLDAGYLGEETAVVESWMLDSDYLNR